MKLLHSRMSEAAVATDEPFIPPRKKHSILWWIGGILVLLTMLFVVQLFGPSPPIVVSPQTTRITEPLGPWHSDGRRGACACR
jgi:hypothetical protein